MAAEQGRGEHWRGKKPQQARASRSAQPSPRRNRILLPVFGMLLVIGVILGFVLRVSKPTEVYGISMVLSEMKDPHWPVPALGREDGERLMPASAETVKPSQEQSRASILVKLGEAGLNARERPILVYLVGDVIIDSDGPQLITSDAQSLDPVRRTLPLVEVLDKLRKMEHDCFLTLDLRTLDQPWLTGLGALDAYAVYAWLESYYQQYPATKMATLCYCSSGQAPFVNMEWGGGIFALAMQEALNGFSNGWNSKKQTDANVTSDEVAYYVKARVQAWCLQVGVLAELPRYHAHADFILRSASAPQLGEPSVLQERAAYPPELAKAWKAREEGSRLQHYDHAPLAHRRLEAALLRTEQRWLQSNPTGEELKRLLADFKQEYDRFVVLVSEPASVSAVSVFKITAPPITPELQKALLPLDDALQKWSQQPPLKPEEWDGLAKSLKDIFTAQPEIATIKLVNALYAATDINISQLRRLCQLVQFIKFGPYLELQLLRFLDSIPDDQLQRWQGSLKLILDVMRSAEQAVPEDPRAWRTISKMLIDTDARFRQALLDTADTELISSERAQRASTLADVKQQYGTLKEIGQTIELSLKERDACLAELPPLALYDAADPVQATALQEQWDQLIPLVKQMLEKLGRNEAIDLTWSNELRTIMERVHDRRLMLAATRRSLPQNSPFDVTLATLAVSNWSAQERQARIASASNQAREAIRTGLTALDRAQSRLIETNRLELPRVTVQQYYLIRRAKDLLILAGHPAASTLDQSIKDLLSRFDPQNCAKVRQLLGSVWAGSVTQLEANQRLWYLPAFGEDAEKDPVLQDYREARRQELDWLAAIRLEGWAAALDKTNKDIARSVRDLSGKIK